MGKFELLTPVLYSFYSFWPVVELPVKEKKKPTNTLFTACRCTIEKTNKNKKSVYCTQRKKPREKKTSTTICYSYISSNHKNGKSLNFYTVFYRNVKNFHAYMKSHVIFFFFFYFTSTVYLWVQIYERSLTKKYTCTILISVLKIPENEIGKGLREQFDRCGQWEYDVNMKYREKIERWKKQTINQWKNSQIKNNWKVVDWTGGVRESFGPLCRTYVVISACACADGKRRLAIHRKCTAPFSLVCSVVCAIVISSVNF